MHVNKFNYHLRRWHEINFCFKILLSKKWISCHKLFYLSHEFNYIKSIKTAEDNNRFSIKARSFSLFPLRHIILITYCNCLYNRKLKIYRLILSFLCVQIHVHFIRVDTYVRNTIEKFSYRVHVWLKNEKYLNKSNCLLAFTRVNLILQLR